MAGTIKSVEERTKELEAQGLAKIEERKQAQAEQNAQRAQAFNQQIDSGVAKQTGIYEQNIENQNRSLYEQLDANHINELIGRKKLEESMANMGLTDSGLNRGQQTALTVMHGNADAKARRATADNVQQIMNAIDQLKITAEQQKTSNQQSLDDALSTWYQNAIQENYNNAVTNAATAYKADVEAQSAAEKLAQENYWKQQEHNLAMVKAGYVQQKDGSWVKDQTSEKTAEMRTYAMTLIKNGVSEDEAWESARYYYGAMTDEESLRYAAKQAGYSNAASSAYAAAGGGEAGQAEAEKQIAAAAHALVESISFEVSGWNTFWRSAGEGDGRLVGEKVKEKLEKNETYKGMSKLEKQVTAAYAIVKSVEESFPNESDESNLKRIRRACEEYSIADYATAAAYYLGEEERAQEQPKAQSGANKTDAERVQDYYKNAGGMPGRLL